MPLKKIKIEEVLMDHIKKQQINYNKLTFKINRFNCQLEGQYPHDL